MKDKHITTFRIEKKLGVKRNRLKEWLNYLPRPTIEKADGQGTKNIFSLLDVYIIVLFKYITERGFTREDAGMRVKLLYGNLAKPYDPEAVNEANWVAFPYKKEGKYLDPDKVRPGVVTPDNFAYFGDVFCEPTLAKLSSKMQILYEKNPFRVDLDTPIRHPLVDEIFIVNFKKIRDEVERAFK